MFHCFTLFTDHCSLFFRSSATFLQSPCSPRESGVAVRMVLSMLGHADLAIPLHRPRPARIQSQRPCSYIIPG